MSSSKLIKGAAILGAAALVSKVLGAVYRIPYQNITGDLGLYVYTQVYPIFTILLILSTAGFPVAISKIVSEKLVHGDHQGARKVFYLSAVLLSLTGFLFFCFLYFGAPILARLAGDEQLIMPYRSVAYAILIVPVMAAMRGYFHGHQNMVPTAVSQIVEQIVRVATILVLSYWFIANGYSVYYAASGAVFGAFTGSVAAMLILFYYWIRHQRETERTGLRYSVSGQESMRQLIGKILTISIPVALGALVLPLFQLADAFSVKNMLDWLGYSDTASKMLKGVYDRGQPLVQFAAFLATPLAQALVPSISEAKAMNLSRAITSRTELALRLTLLIGLPASVGLAVIAGPVNVSVYKTDEGTAALAVLAFTSIFSTLGITTAGILQGLGHVVLPARNLFIGVLIKIALNILLIPLWDITGAALATVLAYGVATFLNLVAVNRYTGILFSLNDFVFKPVISVTVMAAGVFLTEELCFMLLEHYPLHERLLNGIVVLVSVSTGVVFYGVALLLSGAVRARDFRAIPKLKKVEIWLKNMGLLKD